LTVVDLDGRRRELTSGPADFDPRWSPRGERILFMREVGPGAFVLATIPARGGRATRLPGQWVDVEADWSPDGTSIALAGVRAAGDGRYRLYVLDTAGGAPRELARAPDAVRPAWSPDGDRIAFATQDGRVATVAPSGGPIETLVDLGDADIRDLAWSPDGSRLVFSAAKPPPED
jgi:TolB protein